MKMPLQSQIKIMNLRNLHASMTRGIHFDGDGDGEVKKRRQAELHVVPFVAHRDTGGKNKYTRKK